MDPRCELLSKDVPAIIIKKEQQGDSTGDFESVVIKEERLEDLNLEESDYTVSNLGVDVKEECPKEENSLLTEQGLDWSARCSSYESGQSESAVLDNMELKSDYHAGHLCSSELNSDKRPSLKVLKCVTKNHKCVTCGKRFPFKSGLINHMLYHAGDKPFKCNTCGMYFRHKGNLNSHARRHSEEKKDICGTCGKCFKSQRNLRIHERLHSELTCDVCGLSYTRRDLFSLHMSQHLPFDM